MPPVRLFIIALAVCLVSGCANIPLREGGLAVDKDTTAGIEDLGVARVTRGF